MERLPNFCVNSGASSTPVPKHALLASEIEAGPQPDLCD